MFSVSFRLLLFENIYQKVDVPSGDKILGIGRRFFLFVLKWQCTLNLNWYSWKTTQENQIKAEVTKVNHSLFKDNIILHK